MKRHLTATFAGLVSLPLFSLADSTNLVQRLVIVGSTNEVREGLPTESGSGTVTIAPDNILAGQEKVIEQMFQTVYHSPVTLSEFPKLQENMRSFQTNVVRLCIDLDHLVVDVFWPTDVAINNGVLQLVVMEGKVGQISVKRRLGEAKESDTPKDADRLKNTIHVNSNGTISGSSLQEDLEWLNRKNPGWRRFDATFSQGNQLGTYDLDLKVAEKRFPVQFFAGFDDMGNKYVGDYRWNAGASWQNALALGHRMDYQFTGDIQLKHLNAHSVSYAIPMEWPWRNTLSFSGSYGQVDPDLGNAQLRQHGEAWSGSMRSEHMLPSLGPIRHSAWIGFEFKRSDYNIDFVGPTNTTPILQTPVEVAQLVGGYSAGVQRSFGYMDGGIDSAYSPGNIGFDNNPDNLSKIRTGLTPNYWWLRGQGEFGLKIPTYQSGHREEWLKRDFNDCLALVGHGTVQYSSDRLLFTEQLGIGGQTTVRGYDERIVFGDKGYFGSVELRFPRIPLFLPVPPGGEPSAQVEAPAPAWGRSARNPAGGLQTFLFTDYGTVNVTRPSGGEEPNSSLWSFGIGANFNLTRHFMFSIAYGRQIFETRDDAYLSRLQGIRPDSDRFHLKATLFF